MRYMRAIYLLVALLTVVWADDVVRVVKPLPSFTLPGIDGQSITSSNCAGKTLVIWLFASWDKPCRKLLPVMQEFQREYGSNGVMVLGVALDSKGPEPVQAFVASNRVNFAVALADYDFIQAVGGLEAVPTTLIVEPHGNIIGRYVGVLPKSTYEADLRAILDQNKH